ncbi:MAG TPA: hypothetical protein VFK32_10575 [Tepidiformaceae bacterium]|nr:hypothetical protein [Tepidiformaceae bacterium]
MTMTTLERIRIDEGMPVITLDGHRVGQVKDVSDHFFKVGVRWHRDFWLARNQVLAADGEGARLVFAREQLDTYKLARPDYEYEGVDSVISAEEQAEQRARLERDLPGSR